MSGIKLNSLAGGSLSISPSNLTDNIVLDLSDLVSSGAGTNIDGDIVITGADLIPTTFSATFTPPVFLIPRSIDTGAIDFSNVLMTLVGSSGGELVPFVLAETDDDPLFEPNTFRIGSTEITGYSSDIITNGIVLGTLSDIGNNAVWSQPTAMTINNASVEVPIRYKTKGGNVIQATIAKSQFTFADFVAGADAISVDISGYTAFSLNAGDAYIPANATLVAKVSGIKNPVYTWAVTGATFTGSGDTIIVTPSENTPGIEVTLSVVGDNVTIPQTKTIRMAVVYSGAVGQAGANGMMSAFPAIYKWTNSPSTPSRPTTTSTYTWSTGAFAAPDGWFTQTQSNTNKGEYLWSLTIPLTVVATTTESTLDWSNTANPIRAIAYTGTDGTDGSGSIVAILSNDNHTLPSDKNGNVTTFYGATTTMSVFVGETDDSANWTYSSTYSNVTSSTTSDNRTQTVDTFVAASDSGYIDITASKNGHASITKRFSITKSKQGIEGADSIVYYLLANTTVINKSISGLFTPASIQASLYKVIGSSAPVVANSIYFRAYESTDGSTYTLKDTQNSVSSITYTPTSNAKTVKISAYLDSTFNNLLDSQVYVVVSDGATGSTGNTGSAGSATFVIKRTADDSTAPTNAEVSAVIGRTPVSGDICTVSYNNSNNAVVYRYVINAWILFTTYITGSLIVENTITGDKIAANTVKAGNIDSRGLTIYNAAGKPILVAGSAINWTELGSASSNLTGLGYVGDLNATRNVFTGNWVTATEYVVGDIVLDSQGYGWSCIVDHTSSALIKPPIYPTTSNTNWKLYTVKGADAISVVMSNESHTFSAASDGSVAAGSYVGSGTEIRVYDGSVALVYDGVGTSNGTWKVTAVGTNITVADGNTFVDSGDYVTIPQHSGVAAGTDVSSIVYTITGVSSTGTTFTTTKTQTFSKSKTGATGTNAIVGVLSNESTNVPAASDGTVSSFAGATTTLSIFNGATDDSANWTYAVTKSNVTCTEATTSRTQTVNGMTADSGYVDIVASRTGYSSITKRFVVNKTKAGSIGSNATAYWMTVSAAAIQKNVTTGVYNPTSVTVNAYSATGTNAPTAYSGKFKIYKNGSATADYITSGTESSKNYTISGTVTSIKAELYLADGTTKVDEQTIPVVFDGEKGDAGLAGITVTFSNEAHVLPASNSGTVSSYLDSGFVIQAYEGITQLTASATEVVSSFRVGTITQSPTGTITVATPSYYAGTITFADHSGMADAIDSVTLTIPITVYRANGTSVTINKVQSITKSKTGVAGINAAVNYSSSEKWAVGTDDGIAPTGGNFIRNGDGNIRDWSVDPFKRPALVWKSINNDTTSNADGGWNKSITDITANKSYISFVYFRRTSDSTTGSFYHGCSGSTTLNMVGTDNSDPYFYTSNIGNFVKDEWYVSVGIIHANNSTATTNSGISGIYKISTGEKVYSGNDFKMAFGATSQVHRTYLYYSTNPLDSIEWWGPGFYEMNGNEPTLYSITGQGGPTLSISSDRGLTFSATDGILDSEQSSIILTANLTGLASTDYVWTFNGFQTNPTASTTKTQTITSSQFGTSKSATVTCTVAGVYSDSVSIVRLEKSTAAAGATKNKTYVQSTIPSFANSGDLWYCTADASIHRWIGTTGVDVVDASPYQFMDASSSSNSMDEIIVPFSLAEAIFKKSGNVLYILSNSESLSGVSVYRSTTLPSYNDRIWFTDGYATVESLYLSGNNTTLTAYTTLPTTTLYPTILTGYYKASTLYRSNGYSWTSVSTSNFISSGLLSSRPTGANGDFYFATDTNILYQKMNGSWQSTSTSGAPAGTYVGGTLAETVAEKANAALSKSTSSILSATVSVDATAGAGFLAGNLAWDANGTIVPISGTTYGKGVAMTPGGLVGHNGTKTTFAVDATTGNATFGGTLNAASGSFAGSLSAATGTFSGTLTANAINAVNTINIADQAVTLPLASHTDGEVSGNNSVVQSLTINSSGGSIILIFSARLYVGLSGYGSGWMTYTAGSGIRIKRNGTVVLDINNILAASASVNSSGSGYYGGSDFEYFSYNTVDTPGAGTFTYSVEQYWTGSANSLIATKSTLVLLEAKK